MHFVKKQPTTEEERAVKEKERAKKLRFFTTVRDCIFEKRSKNENDAEQLEKTAVVLSKNPDIYTFWNIRREVISEMSKNLLEHEELDTANAKIAQLLDDELRLTFAGIEQNPKSYSAWHHRGWTLSRHPKPNLELDLKLCEGALKKDCRNFHCWDHRRVVAALANLDDAEELEFSNRLINENFSNFSAWHYRAALHLRRADNANTPGILSSDIVKEDLKKAVKGFYTDPADLSAWVYSRFLVESTDEEFSPKLPVIISATIDSQNTTLVFSHALSKEDAAKFVTVPSDVTWTPKSRIPTTRIISAKIWQINSANVSLKNNQSLPYIDKSFLKSFFYFDDKETSDSLQECVEQIKELLEIEEDCVWGWLTYTSFLVHTTPASSSKDIVCNLEKLAQMDPMRKQLYHALRDRHVIGAYLRSFSDEDNAKTNLETLLSEGRLRLTNLGLNSVDALWPLAGYITDLDLSANSITSLEGFTIFARLQQLTLQENNISRIPRDLAELNELEFVSLAGNKSLADITSVTHFLQALNTRNFRFLFAETPLSSHNEELRSAIGNDHHIRLIPFWM